MSEVVFWRPCRVYDCCRVLDGTCNIVIARYQVATAVTLCEATNMYFDAAVTDHSGLGAAVAVAAAAVVLVAQIPNETQTVPPTQPRSPLVVVYGRRVYRLVFARREYDSDFILGLLTR